MQKNPPEENVEEDTRVAGAAADEAAALVAEVDAETLANQTASGGGASTSGGAGKPMGATPAMVDRPVDDETAPEPAPEEPQDGDYGQSILELKAEMEEMSVMLASANKEKDAAEAKLRALPSVDLLSESSMEVFSIDDAIAVRDVVLSGSPLVKEALPETTAFSLGMPSAAFNCGAKSLYTLRAGYEESGADQILGYTADVLGRIVMPTMAIDPGTMEHATALAESLGTEEDHVLDTEVKRALAANSIMAPDTPAGPVPTMRESSEYIADLDLQYFGVDGSFKTRHHQSKGRLMSMPVFSTADRKKVVDPSAYAAAAAATTISMLGTDRQMVTFVSQYLFEGNDRLLYESVEDRPLRADEGETTTKGTDHVTHELALSFMPFNRVTKVEMLPSVTPDDISYEPGNGRVTLQRPYNIDGVDPHNVDQLTTEAGEIPVTDVVSAVGGVSEYVPYNVNRWLLRELNLYPKFMTGPTFEITPAAATSRVGQVFAAGAAQRNYEAVFDSISAVDAPAAAQAILAIGRSGRHTRTIDSAVSVEGENPIAKAIAVIAHCWLICPFSTRADKKDCVQAILAGVKLNGTGDIDIGVIEYVAREGKLPHRAGRGGATREKLINELLRFFGIGDKNVSQVWTTTTLKGSLFGVQTRVVPKVLGAILAEGQKGRDIDTFAQDQYVRDYAGPTLHKLVDRANAHFQFVFATNAGDKAAETAVATSEGVLSAMFLHTPQPYEMCTPMNSLDLAETPHMAATSAPMCTRWAALALLNKGTSSVLLDHTGNRLRSNLVKLNVNTAVSIAAHNANVFRALYIAIAIVRYVRDIPDHELSRLEGMDKLMDSLFELLFDTKSPSTSSKPVIKMTGELIEVMMREARRGGTMWDRIVEVDLTESPDFAWLQTALLTCRQDDRADRDGRTTPLPGGGARVRTNGFKEVNFVEPKTSPGVVDWSTPNFVARTKADESDMPQGTHRGDTQALRIPNGKLARFHTNITFMGSTPNFDLRELVGVQCNGAPIAREENQVRLEIGACHQRVLPTPSASKRKLDPTPSSRYAAVYGQGGVDLTPIEWVYETRPEVLENDGTPSPSLLPKGLELRGTYWDGARRGRNATIGDKADDLRRVSRNERLEERIRGLTNIRAYATVTPATGLASKVAPGKYGQSDIDPIGDLAFSPVPDIQAKFGGGELTTTHPLRSYLYNLKTDDRRNIQARPSGGTSYSVAGSEGSALDTIEDYRALPVPITLNDSSNFKISGMKLSSVMVLGRSPYQATLKMNIARLAGVAHLAGRPYTIIAGESEIKDRALFYPICSPEKLGGFRAVDKPTVIENDYSEDEGRGASFRAYQSNNRPKAGPSKVGGIAYRVTEVAPMAEVPTTTRSTDEVANHTMGLRYLGQMVGRGRRYEIKLKKIDIMPVVAYGSLFEV